MDAAECDILCKQNLYLEVKNGTPERIRTSDLRLRRPLLYPAELQAQD